MATTQSTPGQVEFLIKKYPGGKFSGLLDDGITVGDELSLTGPYGTIDPQGRACAARSSASPVGPGWRRSWRSCDTSARPESTRPVRFYYGARTAADLFYIDEIRRAR